MASVKALAVLIFLVIFLSEASSSPIKEKDETLKPQESRYLRIKSVVSARNPPSSSSNSGSYPDPNASVARFDSSFQPPADVHSQQEQTTQKEDSSKHKVTGSVFEPADTSVQQFQTSKSAPSIKTPVTHSHPSTVSSFGERIPKNGEKSKPFECSVKGGCIATAGVESVADVPLRDTTSDEDKWQAAHAQSATKSPHDEEQQFATHEPTRPEQPYDITQNNFDVNNGFPDYEGLISSQGFPGVTQGEIPSLQEFADEENEKTVSDRRPATADFDYPSFVMEQPFSDSFPVQTGGDRSQPSGFSSSSPDFASEQNYENQHTNVGEERTQQGALHPVPHDFTSGTQDSLNREHQQAAVQPNAPYDDSHLSTDDGQYHHYGNPIDWLRYSVPGNPGEDYPIFYQVPQTSFSCQQQPFSAGIFGDMEASCQVFHVCKENGGQDSFLCPNGTVFNQEYFVCDWWYNFRCADTPSFYNLNAHLYWDWDSFTPSQVLNVPPTSDDRIDSNFQTGVQDTFSTIPGNEYKDTAEDKTLGHSNSVKSTIAVDNSAVFDNNRRVHEQIPEEHAFTEEKSNTKVNFQDTQKQTYENTSPFVTQFTNEPESVYTATVSPFNNRNEEIFPSVSTFTGNNNKQNGNNISPIVSDTGANRQQTPDDAGTRYPDQDTYRQSPNSFQSRDQNGLQQFDISQEIASDVGHSDGVVSQGELPDSFDGNNVQAFNQNQNDDTNYPPESSFVGNQNQVPENFFADKGSKTPDYRQTNQNAQQDYSPTSNFGTQPVVTNTRDENYDTQTQKSFFDNNQQNTLTDVRVDDEDRNRNSEVQQEQINTSFDRNNENSYQDENSSSFDSHNQNAVTQDDRTTPFNTGINNNFESHEFTVNPDSQGNQVVQQEHVPTSFEDQNRNTFDSGKMEGDYQAPFNDQNEDTRHFISEEQANTGVTTSRDQNVDLKGSVQQKQIPVFDDVKPNEPSGDRRPDSERRDADQRQITTSFQQNDQRTFGSDEARQDQNFRGNNEVQQDHIPIPFDEQRPDIFDSNRNNNVQEEFSPNLNQGNNVLNNRDASFGNRNNVVWNPVFQQAHIPTSFEDSRPNSHNIHQGSQTHQPNDENSNENTANKNKFDDQYNQQVQENTFSPFGGSTQEPFTTESDQRKENGFVSGHDQRASSFSSNAQNNYNQGQNNGSPSDQPDRRPLNVEQQNIPVSLVENRPNPLKTPVNGNNNQQEYQQQTQFGGMSPNNFQVNNPEIQQQYLQTPFHGNENERDRIIQDGYVNNDQGFRVNVNQQSQLWPINNGNQQSQLWPINNGNQQSQLWPINNGNQQSQLWPINNGNQQGVQVPQNLRQEQTPSPFENNQENNFNTQNTFNQENQRNAQQSNQKGFQPDSGANQNANAAFQMRLNNFQPENIHMMNRGAYQNGDNQQRLSFRPYGQNDRNVVHFPGNIPIDFIQNQQNGASPEYSNNNGPSNQNFFVTNGHQVQDDQYQQTDNRPFSDQRPPNDIQDNRQYGPQEFIQEEQKRDSLAGDGIRQNTEIQNTNVNVAVPPFSVDSNQNINSRVKGFSSENYSRGKSIDFSLPQTSEVNPRGLPTVAVNADDVVAYNQPAPESPSSMAHNGWKPVIKY